MKIETVRVADTRMRGIILLNMEYIIFSSWLFALPLALFLGALLHYINKELIKVSLSIWYPILAVWLIIGLIRYTTPDFLKTATWQGIFTIITILGIISLIRSVKRAKRT